jgi:Type I restriction enzyme R protein N terminus (HSDR_N)
MAGHHLILGEVTDLITGDTILDTQDERCRQQIAHLLLNQKGYQKMNIKPRNDLLVQAGEKRAVIKIDFLINIGGKICMIIKFGPGSIVTRRRSLLAASRVLAPYQIPIAVVTNGEDAEILQGTTGKIISRGLATIPDREQLKEIICADRFHRIPAERAEMESRLLYCYEVDGSCPCDENVCKL